MRYALATLLACLAFASSASAFEVGMVPHSYVTFQRGHHPPRHQEFGYFSRPQTWREVRSCQLRATHHGQRVGIEVGNHRLTNPHPFHVWVRC